MSEPFTAARVRRLFREFFLQRGHALLPSASLIPENDPSVLFTTAGMQPLIPYFLGQAHPLGRRLANVQKCVRVQDVNEVGDARHDTFFEMLGNWSLGDYFKREAIAWSYEFVTGRDWLAIPPNRLSVSVFAGDADAPRDEESIVLWQEQFQRSGIDARVAAGINVGAASGARIYAYGKEKNWWGPVGETGPCGPDTEMFFDIQPSASSPTGHVDTGMTDRYGPSCHPNCDCGRYVEFWNDVFMEYNRTGDGQYVSLAQKNVDTGMGLERVLMILQGKEDIFDTDVFRPLMAVITAGATSTDRRTARIVADHVRTSTFLVGDGVQPSNVDRGYVLRRLLRRAVRFGDVLGLPRGWMRELVVAVVETYGDEYPELRARQSDIREALEGEEAKFRETLARGLREFDRLTASGDGRKQLGGQAAFTLFATYGFPFELTAELARERKLSVDEAAFRIELKKHQERSRASSMQHFSGGLADHSDRTVQMHTATHLLHEALRRVLGPHVRQKGSNITSERLRFDFSHPAKLSTEEIRSVEALVNAQIACDLTVTKAIMTPAEARATGALGFFEETYGDQVSVYAIGDFSKEVCGGPHVGRTGELGKFRVLKEEGLAAGVRRIRAVVE